MPNAFNRKALKKSSLPKGWLAESKTRKCANAMLKPSNAPILQPCSTTTNRIMECRLIRRHLASRQSEAAGLALSRVGGQGVNAWRAQSHPGMARKGFDAR